MIAMEPDGSQERSLTKTCIPFITGFTLVAGLAMFVTGVVVMIAQIAHEAISSVPIQTGPIVLLVAGLLSLLVACFGCYFKKQNLTLNDMGKKKSVFMVLLLLAAVLAIVAGCLGINHRGKMENKFEADLKTKIEMYGRTGYETEAQIDRLQKEDKCCGVFTYADWRATVYGGHRYDRVPDSCCKEQKYGCGFKFIDEATLNKKGCASIAMDKMYTGLTSVGAVGLLFAISELILFLGFLICYLKHCCQVSNPPEIGTVMIEYHKTDTPSGQEGVEPSSRGGDVTGEHGDGASSTTGHDAPTAKR